MNTDDKNPTDTPPRGPDILEIAPIVNRWINCQIGDRECAAELARLEAGASGHPAVREIWASFARWPLVMSNIAAIERALVRAIEDVLLEEDVTSARFALALALHPDDDIDTDSYLKARRAERTLERLADQIDDMVVTVPRIAFASIREVVDHVDDAKLLRRTIRSLLAWAAEVA